MHSKLFTAFLCFVIMVLCIVMFTVIFTAFD